MEQQQENRREIKRRSYKKSVLQQQHALERARRWVAANRFAYSLRQSRYDAKVRGFVACTATIEELRVSFTGFCEVCGTPEIECNRKLHMDHNHETGGFRGWLCSKCNHALGLFNDNPDVLERAAQYIRLHNAANEAEPIKVCMENVNTF